MGIISYPKSLSFYPPAKDFFESFKINLGLDLQGGMHLEYKADISGIESDRVETALQAAQDVVERRVNAFGVSESLVQTSKCGQDNCIIIELPGIKDMEEAKSKIKDTVILEFKEEGEIDPEIQTMFDNLNSQTKVKAEEALERVKKGDNFEELVKELSQDPETTENGGDLGYIPKDSFLPELNKVLFEENLNNGDIYQSLVETQLGWHIVKFVESRGEGDDLEVKASHIFFGKKDPSSYDQFRFKPTGLTGKNLEKAQESFPNGPGLGTPEISLKFDEEGTKLFAEITKRNIEKPLAIFLDGELLSSPTVQNEITNGEAVITGSFTLEEVQEQVRRLNEGSIPVPLELVSESHVEATLGEQSLRKSLKAGMMGMLAVIVYMIFYYRLPGLIASMGILIYVALMISIFKFSGSFTPWPITLSLSGIAGFILTIGMAVDANVLIFERIKEELRNGKSIPRSIEEGFRRAWPSIRDGNFSTIITSVILFWVGTSFVKGFALILIIGVSVSMFTAIVIVKVMMKYLIGDWIEEKIWLMIPTRVKK